MGGVGLGLACYAELEVNHLLALQAREATLLNHGGPRGQN